MKFILAYGDSLVYGKMPGTPKRYERSKNFIGILEHELGNNYRIVDEGLRARTLSGENSFFQNRNGLTQFGPILGSHLPLDLVCIFLGVNDCNKKDTKNNNTIFDSLHDYKNQIVAWCKDLSVDEIPKLMIISPSFIRAEQLATDSTMSDIFGHDSEERSKNLKTIYKDFCDKENCIFFDASTCCITANGEGVHLDEENNALLGKALAEKIKSIF